MNDEREITDVGSQVGSEAADHIAARAEDYCKCERRRIELSHQARISALHIEGSRLTELERQLEERLRLAPPSGNARSHERKARFYWFIGGLLVVAAFFFSLIAFAPYRLGWYGDLYCLGVALVTPFAIEVFLDAWKSERIFKAVVTVVFLSALGGGALLAAIRGNLLAQQVQDSAPAIIIDGATPSAPPPQNSFYDSTGGSLGILMLLLALAIDLGSGVAIHRALLLGASSSEDFEKLSQELGGIHERLAAIVFEITALTNAPDIFVARFWRDFYRAMLTQTMRKAATKILGLSLCLLVFSVGRAFAEGGINLVVAVDLSASEAVKGHDEQTQFSKNIEGVGRLLVTVPAGSKVTVIGITGNSFGQPYVLLSAEISGDQGYFGERLASARQQLVRTWQKQSAQLQPNARSTDVLGALLLAGELLKHSSSVRKDVLVIYSDMRNTSDGLNLENATVVNVQSVLAALNKRGLLPDLRGATAYVSVANAAGVKIGQWGQIRRFWERYFAGTGATVAEYSTLDEMPNLEP